MSETVLRMGFLDHATHTSGDFSRTITLNGQRARGYRTENGAWVLRHLTLERGTKVLDSEGNTFLLIGSELVDDAGKVFVVIDVQKHQGYLHLAVRGKIPA